MSESAISRRSSIVVSPGSAYVRNSNSTPSRLQFFNQILESLVAPYRLQTRITLEPRITRKSIISCTSQSFDRGISLSHDGARRRNVTHPVMIVAEVLAHRDLGRDALLRASLVSDDRIEDRLDAVEVRFVSIFRRRLLE